MRSRSDQVDPSKRRRSAHASRSPYRASSRSRANSGDALRVSRGRRAVRPSAMSKANCWARFMPHPRRGADSQANEAVLREMRAPSFRLTPALALRWQAGVRRGVIA